MRILLYSISYSPEGAGSGRFNGELTEWLAERGHHVDVITAHPYYPEWRVPFEYRGRGWFVERKGNLTVYRTPLYVPTQVTGKTRILHELSFVASSAVHWVRSFFVRYDAVIAVCPPLQVGVLPYLYSRLRRRPFVFHIQDLQVDAARNLGMIKSERLLDILDKIEKFILRKATKVSSISEGMKSNILSKGVKDSDYFMLENWVDTTSFSPLPVERSVKAELGFKSTDKIALYSGNIGEKQGLEILIGAAKLLQKYADIKIVISGEGAARERLQQQVAQLELTNVLFFPIQPFERLPSVLAMADVHLVIQKRAASDLVMPSKLTNILAMGGASVVSADGGTSLSDVIIRHNLGWAVEPENEQILADAIFESMHSDYLPSIRRNARLYAEQFLEKDAILRRYEDILLSIC